MRLLSKTVEHLPDVGDNLLEIPAYTFCELQNLVLMIPDKLCNHMAERADQLNDQCAKSVVALWVSAHCKLLALSILLLFDPVNRTDCRIYCMQLCHIWPVLSIFEVKHVIFVAH